jgi:hypothetical protein
MSKNSASGLAGCKSSHHAEFLVVEWWSETAKRGKFLITLRLLRRERERKNWGKREIIK